MATYIEFVTSMIYTDLGAADLGPAPGGTKTHLQWSLDRLSSPPALAGEDFLEHHLDVMLARYEQWRGVYTLPPARPWDGSNVFPHPGSAAVGPTIPGDLAGGPFPGGWALDDLGTSIEGHYDTLRNYVDSGRSVEMTDEVKAPFSYRYWAFMKWAYDLRERFEGRPVFPVSVVYDRDGTILSEKEYMDHANDIHHVWHPNADGDAHPPASSWTDPTPGYRTSIGQYRRKKQISRAQVGYEFFTFHRDLIGMMDRWLAKTGQDPIPPINMCAHDIPSPDLGSVPAGLDVSGIGLG